MAGIAPRDVDVLTIYDPFTIAVLIQIEDMGFCTKGEGGLSSWETGSATSVRVQLGACRLTPMVGSCHTPIGLCALYLCSKGCYATGVIFHGDGGLQTTNLPFRLPDL